MCANDVNSQGIYTTHGGDSYCEDCDYAYLPNVESDKFQILGSISLTGDPLLTSLQLGSPGGGVPLLPSQVLPSQAAPNTMMPAPMVPTPMIPASQMPMLPPVPANSKVPAIGVQDTEFLPGPQQQLQQ